MMSGPGMVSLSCERARRLLTFSLAHLRPGRGVELLPLELLPLTHRTASPCHRHPEAGTHT